MVYVSIGLRIRTEVEALNMVEALGAYTRHRTTSILKKISKDGRVSYKIVIVPTVSGQSIAHGYHRALVELARILKLPVCDECGNYEAVGGFPKRATMQNVPHDDRVKGCVVESLTGFMAAGPAGAAVRMTSPVSFSYLVPDIESAKASLDPQFHVRYDFRTAKHAPFTIESGSAVYMLSIAIDVDKIGRLEKGGYVDDRNKRIELAFKALAVLIDGFVYGAKKARYLPLNEVVGGIAAISHPLPFMVSPPRVYRDGRNYIDDTLLRARYYLETLKWAEGGEKLKLFYMDKEGLAKEGARIEGIEANKVSTFSEMVEKILEVVGEFLSMKK